MRTTFTEYATKLRIEKVKHLLLETNMPIYRIAVEPAFQTPPTLAKYS
ncbi:hypothetical protein IIE26_27565 (plasmid) [Cytobacillus oceanisediminis]|nr:hypothetical protein IIE26_27565 [Cytobacillus oceanisediminis]